MSRSKREGFDVTFIDPDSDGDVLCGRWFYSEVLARAYVLGVVDGLGIVEDQVRVRVFNGELEVTLESGWSE